jgi:hypothetical protein
MKQETWVQSWKALYLESYAYYAWIEVLVSMLVTKIAL